MIQDDTQTPAPVRVIGCGMIAREILAVSDQLGFSHIDLKCLPAMWHHHPEKIAPGVDQAIEQAKSEGFEKIFVAYADCGTGGHLDRVCDKHGVEQIAGPHCFSFYLGNEEFDQQSDELITLFLCYGFSRPPLSDLSGETAGAGSPPRAAGYVFRQLYQTHLYCADR